MNLTQVGGLFLILTLIPLLGALPLIRWIFYLFTRRDIRQMGTGNISVSAAFYHGGTVTGVLAVLSEASKGIIAVLLARHFFPNDPTWELLSLIALVIGRYWGGKGAGVTNVLWGMMVHDWQATVISSLISLVGFTLVRERRFGRLLALFILALILTLRHADNGTYIGMAFILVGLISWILQRIPDDLTLPETGVTKESKQMFQFFRGDKSLLSLNNKLKAHQAGEKASNLSYLKCLGYNVPDGWVLSPGDDPEIAINYLQPSQQTPLIVRSSAIGEDSSSASAAGQYISIPNVFTSEQLKSAIYDCLASYNRNNASQYRKDFQQDDTAMAVLIQKQIQGEFSGVAFSRDPVNPWHNGVIIEALPGQASAVVSGQYTPQRYQVELEEEINITPLQEQNQEIPTSILEKVAQIARDIEKLYQGMPQDLEWTYDGKQLWILQARPITTLYPIWTRKIAAEVIPGVIRPLTWSINRPVTCGVWGNIFTIVLGNRATGLNFEETATLHYQHAYFNASLLGDIFLRMGLPPESLEFLTRGAKFSKPPLTATIRNIPGLLRLWQRERNLEGDFNQDNQRKFAPILKELQACPPETRSIQQLEERIDQILAILPEITYYSILAPLSFALRQGIAKINPEQLDNSQTPEVASMRSLAELADKERALIAMDRLEATDCASLFAYLADNPDGKTILEQFDAWLVEYGYLGEVGTDIAVPRWRDNPHPVRELFSQFLFNPEIAASTLKDSPNCPSNKLQGVQKRLNLKGKVTEVYSRFLGQLRWSFLALGKQWCEQGILREINDIFFLEISEIKGLIAGNSSIINSDLFEQRRNQYQDHLQLKTVPFVLYGNIHTSLPSHQTDIQRTSLQGIGASSGQKEGIIRICLNLSEINLVDQDTIIVVPYTDSGWTPLLAKAGGLIAEVGGTLSHGAIIAREYGIPAIMDVNHATQRLKDGQRVRIDGQTGTIEIVN
ncbi:MAG: glycerol-3-phosphate acyltransferase [Microcystaceae cyanobacterium]